MKKVLTLLALGAWLTGCSSAASLGESPIAGENGSGGSGSSSGDAGTASHGGTSGGASAGSSSSYNATVGSGSNGGAAGGSSSSGSSGGTTPGCNPAGPAPCQAGMVCDQATQSCRLPGYGEACTPDAGCASQPPGMICSDASLAGSSQELCLVPCSNATDSSACPYGLSCGDPNLPGYCSPQGSGTCTPWTPCSLGTSLVGICVPDGEGVSCVAGGNVATPYAACNPQASNSQATELCANGMICVADAQLPQTLGSSPAEIGGYCVPPCGGTGSNALTGPSCSPDEHCFEAAGGAYGLCLPGSPCSLGGSQSGSQSCQYGWWCLPDSFDAEAGGCIKSVADAGAAGDECQQPEGFTTTNPCQAGSVCLPDLNGYASCETVCLLTPNTGEAVACACTAVGDAGAVGVCAPDAG